MKFHDSSKVVTFGSFFIKYLYIIYYLTQCINARNALLTVTENRLGFEMTDFIFVL